MNLRCAVVVASLARPIKSTPQRIHPTIENPPTSIQTTPEYTMQSIRWAPPSQLNAIKQTFNLSKQVPSALYKRSVSNIPIQPSPSQLIISTFMATKQNPEREKQVK